MLFLLFKEFQIGDFNQLFSSSSYIHGICDNNNIFTDIITDKDIESEIYDCYRISHQQIILYTHETDVASNIVFLQ